MSAYVVVQADMKPGPELDAYRQQAGAAIAKYGGRFLVRGKEKLFTEGHLARPAKVIIMEFDSGETARRWYDSPEYAEALKLRDAAMVRELFVVDGA
jgi:uncharacterized protein (DUF1330 family)